MTTEKSYTRVYIYMYIDMVAIKSNWFSQVLCLIKWNSSISFYCWIVGCGVGLPIVLHVFMVLSLKRIRS